MEILHSVCPGMDEEVEMALTVLYRDAHIVVVHKPSGMPVHRGGRENTFCTAVVQSLRDRLGQHVYPVHRLDRPTSGVLVLGLHPEAASRMSVQFRCHEVQKDYLALVRGRVPPGGVITRLLRPEENRHGRARFSITKFHRVDCLEIPVPMGKTPTRCYSLVELHPETGRSRQIRRHLRSISHPIIGDTAFGDGRHTRFFREQFGCTRLMLAAVRLSLRHPVSGGRLTVAAPLASDFMAVLARLGMDRGLPSVWVHERSM
ncbi:pseudouridine synthase [Desulfobotulus sp. H1]|uniref:tRNA pseudouridine synthase C n=1 Tax=Desulfobotulus pelophilus TaxID=2823377 RepID=A0ABT3N653_9BACT|nr:pseudouridine synthase [Desulfobotulus pelophilus]MCW7752933.1 pseudouridine synthase [Desulfobotulus pelophilus]